MSEIFNKVKVYEKLKDRDKYRDYDYYFNPVKSYLTICHLDKDLNPFCKKHSISCE